ncbi:MAG: hypothetical protein WCD18_25880 [Thermosynechococcaceae cyanobacterium]
MSRPVDPKCLACSRSTRADAIQKYGSSGDGCWVPNVCDRKRSHYRNRKENNVKRRKFYADQHPPSKPETDSLAIPIQAPPVALLYLYRENRKDAHLHALAISVWQGSEKLLEVEPVHCMGMTNRKVNDYLRQVLNTLGDRFGISEFEPPIRMETMECPIPACPLKIPKLQLTD